jgi:hypothetical protein
MKHISIEGTYPAAHVPFTVKHRAPKERTTFSKEVNSLGTSWIHLIFHGPIFGSIFAFSYVVGYFYGINITFYSFFSVTEQVVFALQALPIALGGSMLFLLVASVSLHPKDWGVRSELLFNTMSLMWIGVLFIFTYIFLFNVHSIGGPFCLIAVMVLVVCFQFIHKPQEPFVHIIYWGINVAVICLLTGFITAEYHKKHPILMKVTLNDEDKTPAVAAGWNLAPMSSTGEIVITGQVLFLGNSGFLFKTDEGQVKLYGKQEITNISIP